MPKAEAYERERRELAGVPVEITSYKIGERYFCHVSNLDPGATIARAEGSSREEAVRQAVEKAARRLSPAS